ncbi:MAG: hypothetical protein ABR953_08345 [Candidatus Acidiferrales bacterium]|jgi:hypothetical protein
MRKTFLSRKSLLLVMASLVGAFCVPLAGQWAETVRQPVPMFADWSTRHVVYPRVGPMAAMQAAARDPRARFLWSGLPVPVGGGGVIGGSAPLGGRSGPPFVTWRRPVLESQTVNRDWAINLGAAGTAAAMYPAKFGFDVTAAPSCVNDYVVFPINAPGGSGQPNIVAFNYLYSGTAGATGICNRTASGSDTGVAAEVLWSYNVQGITGGGAVTTSPAISFDPLTPSASGTKVAFVESSSGGQIVAATVTSGHAGTGYAVGNTGTIAGGTSSLATFQVTAVTAGAVTAFTITYTGTGYTVKAGVATTATSGTGTGLEISIGTVSAASAAHFHVLAFKDDDGQNTGNLQSVLTPKTISTFSSTNPAAGSGTATDLVLGSSTTGTDTLSSPFVDYVRDEAYVGNDAGVLYRIKDVFCTSVNSNCSGSTQPAPSLDTTWGSGGAVTVCSGKLTGAVLDFVTLNVFVGCSNGKLYGFKSSGVALASSPLTVGNGSTLGGIVDSPIVDGVNGFVFAVSGSNGTNAVLVQATTSLSSSTTVTVGAAGVFNLHAPAFNNPYYTSPSTSGAYIYVAAYNAAGNEIELYGYCFSSSDVLANCSGVTPAGPQTLVLNDTPGSQLEYAPLTEFYNSTTSNDWLFITVLANRSPNLGLFNINSFPTSETPVPGVQEGSGTSGMVVDNNSSSAQASSVYFGALSTTAACGNGGTGGCAVKLTQAALE